MTPEKTVGHNLTMTEYNFIDDGSDDEDNSDDAAETDTLPSEVRRWTLGDHNTGDAPDREVITEWADTLDDEVDGDLKGVLEEAADLAPSSTVSGFECPACGLNHSHSDSKHDIRASPGGMPGGFRVDEDFADQMEYCPYCHCGANELAMLIDFFHYITVPVFEDQDEFEAVLELDPEFVRRIYRVYTTEEDVYTIDEAIDHARTGQPIGEVRPELKAFIERVHKIKSAADSAPISDETRTAIEEIREELEAMVGSDDGAEWQRGRVTYMSTLTGIGRLEATEDDERWSFADLDVGEEVFEKLEPGYDIDFQIAEIDGEEAVTEIRIPEEE